MTEASYIAYFKNLATKSTDIAHVETTLKKSFFVVDNPFDLTEVDNALRSGIKLPAMLLDIPKFTPSGNGGANYTNTVEGTFVILQKASKGNLSSVRDECLQIGLKFLYRMHYDYKEQMIEAGRPVFFKMEDTDVEPVGPIAVEHYGYIFTFRFICPFSFSVSGASWTDL